MTVDIDKCLAALNALPIEKLHQTNCKLRSDLALAEWRLAISLWVSERRGLPRELEYSSVTEYALKALAVDPQKTADLLRTARALVELPLFSEAFRQGRLCWSTVRALKRVITPETEEAWVEFALDHTSREVERKVVQSPASWKRGQALTASLEGNPTATEEDVQLLLQEPVQAAKASAPSAHATAPAPEPESEPPPQPKQVLPPPKYIRLTIDLTHDQYVIYEAMQDRVWAKRGRKVSNAEVLMELCNQGLDSGTARARARHQVIIHSNDSGQAWYETDRGVLTVSPEVLEEALNRRPPLKETELFQSQPETYARKSNTEELPVADQAPTYAPNSTSKEAEPTDETPTYARKSAAEERQARKDVPNSDLRAVCARAGNRCERCGSRGPLFIHHRKPVSDGGDNSRENLELLCGPCHGLTHEPDYESRPEWAWARELRRGSKPEASRRLKGSDP